METLSGKRRRTGSRRLSGAAAFLLALAATPLPAQPVQNQLVVEWRQELRDAETLLKESKWKPARRKAEAVLDEMEKRFIGGGSAGTLFAAAVFVRAVAAAGLGDDEAAHWDFQMAKALNPNLATTPLAEFGAAGRRLAELAPDPEPPEASRPRPQPDLLESVPQPAGVVTPPEVVHRKQPRYLIAQQMGCVEGTVIVQLVIDRAARVRRLSVLTQQHPILAYALLDALREWRFRPARLGEEPVTVYYSVTVNFRLEPKPPPGSCPEHSAG